MEQGKGPLQTRREALKVAHPLAIILFRIGDFYEAFGTDAEIVASELGVSLVKRGWMRGADQSPMAGVPAHTLTENIKRLNARYEVIVLEQCDGPIQRHFPAWPAERDTHEVRTFYGVIKRYKSSTVCNQCFTPMYSALHVDTDRMEQYEVIQIAPHRAQCDACKVIAWG